MITPYKAKLKEKKVETWFLANKMMNDENQEKNIIKKGQKNWSEHTRVNMQNLLLSRDARESHIWKQTE